jgi:hypothetical protein
MEIVELIASLGAWSWVVAGLVLLAIELVAPGGVFVWLGGAAIATGLLALFSGLDTPVSGWLAMRSVQWAIFGVLSVAGLLLWVRIRRSAGDRSVESTVNRGAARYVGREAVLEEPIVDGFGRIALGDGFWRVSGIDMPAGSKVRVVAYIGAVLAVEPAE